MDFGPAIKAIRKKRGLSQKELSEKTGISQGALSEIENGTRPGADTFILISLALDVPVVALVLLATRYDMEHQQFVAGNETMQLLWPVIDTFLEKLVGEEYMELLK